MKDNGPLVQHRSLYGVTLAVLMRIYFTVLNILKLAVVYVDNMVERPCVTTFVSRC